MQVEDGWKILPLGNVFTFQRGFDITKKEQTHGEYTVISSSGPTSTHNEYKVNGPGVVIGRKGTLGTVFFSEQNFWPHDTTLWIKDFHGNDERFAYYFLKTLKLEQYDCGASNPTLNRNHIHSQLVRFPSQLVVQRCIAAILSAYDDLIENNTRRIAILEEMARRIYEEWFVNFRFPGHENVSFVESELGLIPEGWERLTLSDIAEEKRSSVQPEDVEPTTPYVGLEHIPRRSIALNEWGMAKNVQSTKLVFKGGDILFGKIRPYFHKVAVAPVDGVCSSDAIVIKSKRDDMFPIVLATVSSDDFVLRATQTSNGSKMPRANWGVLLKYPVFKAPEPLQKQFNDFINGAVAQIKILSLKNRNLRSTRDLLLPKLISGEIDVSRFPDLTEEVYAAVAC